MDSNPRGLEADWPSRRRAVLGLRNGKRKPGLGLAPGPVIADSYPGRSCGVNAAARIGTVDRMMSHKRYNPADIESLMASSHEAEAAGISTRTVVDVDELARHLAASGAVPHDVPADRWLVVSFLRVAGPLAACLAIVVGLERLDGPVVTPRPNTSSLVRSELDCIGSGTDQWASLVSFAGCLTGPGQPITLDECDCADLDRDGDVDLLDYGRFQRLAGSRLN